MKPQLNPYRLLLPILVVSFILISVAEVWLLTIVGRWIGIGWTLVILIGEALLGAWLLRREGTKSWSALVSAYQAGRTPTGHLADAALVLAGGIMLILPGFLTDVIGLIFLLPFTRPLARKAVGSVVGRSLKHSGVDLPGASMRGGTIIPGEVISSEVVDSPPAAPPTQPGPDSPPELRG